MKAAIDMTPDELANAKYPHMVNRAMARKLVMGEARDVSAFRIDPNLVGQQFTGCYLLPETWRRDFDHEEFDLCDAEREQWIWSVGVFHETGQVFAATDARFYQNDHFRCVWLR